MVRASMGLPAELPEGAFQHLHWKVAVDVAARSLRATATYTVLHTPSSTGCLALAVEGLAIESVAVNAVATEYKVVEMTPTNDQLHSTLAIAVPKHVVAPYTVAVTYHLAKPSLACHWLNSEWLITQTYPSYAPSLLPIPPQLCMKFTYTADVTTSALATVLMSAATAEATQVSTTTQVVVFQQSVPVPSHLVALVIYPTSTLETPTLTSTYTVHTSAPTANALTTSVLDKFPALAAAAEGTTGLPWTWSPLNIVVVPHDLSISFRWTCTPSLLVVDADSAQSVAVLADAVASHWMAFRAPHETWDDVWLSEAWTKWLQLEALQAVESAAVSVVVADGLAALTRAMTLEAGSTLVAPHHSSSQWSVVGREKGYLLLRHVQEIVGVEAFQYFVSAFISGFEKGSVTTAEFCEFCNEYFTHVEELPPLPVAWDTWLHSPGHCPTDDELEVLTGLQAPVAPPSTLVEQSVDVNELVQVQFTLELCAKMEQIQRERGASVALDVWLECCELHTFHPVTVQRIEALIQSQVVEDSIVDAAPQLAPIPDGRPTELDAIKNDLAMSASTSTWLMVAFSVGVCVASVAMGLRLVSVRSA